MENTNQIEKTKKTVSVYQGIVNESAKLCQSLTQMDLSIFCKLKGIKTKDRFLKDIQKTEYQLSFDEKKEYTRCWDMEDLLQLFVDAKISGVNPASNLVHIMKYGDRPTIVYSYHLAMQKAEAHDKYDGFRNGIIVMNIESGEIIRREGEWHIQGKEEIIAGWAEVYRKDRSHPTIAEPAFMEYMMSNALAKWEEVNGKKIKTEVQNSQWANRSGGQIAKVALSQAQKKAFPGLFKNAEIEGSIPPEVQDVDYIDVTDVKTSTLTIETKKLEAEQKTAKDKKNIQAAKEEPVIEREEKQEISLQDEADIFGL